MPHLRAHQSVCARALVTWGEQHLLRFVSRPSQSRRAPGPAQVTSLTYRTGEKGSQLHMNGHRGGSESGWTRRERASVEEREKE